MSRKLLVSGLLWLLCLGMAAEILAQPRRPRRRPELPGSSAKWQRFPDKLSQGDNAPDFTLKLLSGKGEVTLSDFEGELPVALVFGSYT